MSDFHPETRTYAGAGDEPKGTTQQAKAAAGEVAETAKDQVRVVAQEAKDQTRQLTQQLRTRTSEQAQQQSKRAADAVRQWTDELASIGDNVKPDSPVRGVVQQVADRGNRVADYLENEGLTGAVRDVQTFARRRPGLFLAGALAAGFLVGRAAKAATGDEEPNGGASTAYGGGHGSGSATTYGTTGTAGTTYGTTTGTTYGGVTGATTGTGTYGTAGTTTDVGTGTAYGAGTTGYPAGDVSDTPVAGTPVTGASTGYSTGYSTDYEDDAATAARRDDGTTGAGGGPR